MKRKFFRSAFVVLLIILSVLLVSCVNDAKDYRVRVMIQDNEGITVKSSAKVDVMPGTSAEFEIEINEGFAYVGNNLGAEYDEASGKLILKNVFYPSTISVEVKPNDDLIHLMTGSNSEKCSISVVSGKEYFASPSDVTVKVEYEDGEVFNGWSLGGLLIEGAELLGTENEITVHVTETSTLYANFASNGGYSIVYHLNGGHVADSDNDSYVVYGEYNELFAMQQTLESNGTFVRDGYVAIGYSTSPAEYSKFRSVNDIPGFSNMGGVCSVPATDKIDLYVVWAKETPAEKFTFKNGTITGFEGGADYVVIPEKINGEEVKKIGSGAFTNNLAITNVVIPRTVEDIRTDAFKNCRYLREVVFFDSLINVSDASFNGSETNLKTVCLNAARLPKYSGSAEGSFCIKYERVRTLEGKKLIVVAGSSTLYGLDSALLEEKMPGYSVVNYGTNGSSTALLFLYAMSNYVNPGDIIIHAPCMWSGGALGMSSIAWELFREDEQCWDIFREVDMTLFTGFFDAYSLYTNGSDAVAAAKNMEGKPYQLLDCGLNKYGDIDYALNKTTYTPGRGDIEDFSVYALQVDNLNKFNDLMLKKGVTYLYSFATHNFTNYSYAYDNAGNPVGSHEEANALRLQVFRHRCDDYTAKCKELFDFPVISNVYDYILDSHYFSNSDWHCTNAGEFNGRKLRTEQLAADLQNYFTEKEEYEKQNNRYVVTIQDCEGVKFKSDSSVTVKYGESVEFKISVDDKHLYVGNSINAKYNEKTHKIVVENVTSSMTIILDVMKKSDMIHVDVVNGNVNCDVSFAEGSEFLINPAKVTLVASSGGRYTFEGWSSGNYLAKGGKLISSDTTYSFNADKSVKIYANFVDTGNYTITYHANGGVYVPTGSDTFKYTAQYSSIFSMQNTLENDGYFKRDGYVAVGYSTSPVKFEDYTSVNDIPGFSNMGGVCLVGDSGELDLYVVWAKETPASAFTFSNGAITKYNGKDKYVVVPASINGVPVKTIKSGAFFNNITTNIIVIPPCMETVETGAFNNVALKQFVFFDTLLNISDESFPNSLNNLKTVVLNAARLPKYSGSSEGSFCIKYERVRTLTGKKIIVMAGSSTLYGLDSAEMERQFPGYSVVNYGTNGSSTGLFFLDACCNYCGEGDIVIDAPCYWSGAQLGSNVIAWELFREDEQCWDIFREVDMSEYTNFFSAYSLYTNGSSSVAAAKNMGGKKYQIAECGLNKYGDVSTVYASTVYSVGGPSSKLSNNLNSTNLNKMNKKFLAKGTTMLFSYATYNFARSAFAYNAVDTPIKFKDELGGHWKNDFYNDCAEHDKYCESVLDFPVISKIRNYFMDSPYFSNSDWHCTNAGEYNGRAVRTAQLCEDLKAYLDKN